MAKWLRRWGMCTRGQGLIEYSLILCLIALSLISVLLLLRNSTGTTYTGVRGNLDQVVACDGSASCASGGTESGASTSGRTSGGGEWEQRQRVWKLEQRQRVWKRE